MRNADDQIELSFELAKKIEQVLAETSNPTIEFIYNDSVGVIIKVAFGDMCYYFDFSAIDNKTFVLCAVFKSENPTSHQILGINKILVESDLSIKSWVEDSRYNFKLEMKYEPKESVIERITVFAAVVAKLHTLLTPRW